MITPPPDLPIARAIAADLAGAQVDVNEAQKALAYLRTRPDKQRAATEFFSYLDKVLTNGSAVIRSGRTLGYYRDLQRICRQHLRALSNDYETMVRTYAWALRLLRYYRAFPDDAAEFASQRKSAPAEPRTLSAIERPKREIPAVGAVFTGAVLDMDDDVVMVEVPGFASSEAIGLIRASVGNRPRYRVGNAARVEVISERTTKAGVKVLEIKPALKNREGNAS